MNKPVKKPVTVVTGFLGSGKTTLLSRVLLEPEGANTAVLVNEFGEIGLDHHLLRRSDEKTVLLGHGCVCCTTRDDLVEALLALLDEEDRGEIPPLDRVVVETTGLADPAPILYTIFSHPVLQHHYRVDLVVSTVDAINGALHLDHNPESIKQVAAADKVILTKTDVAERETAQNLIARLRTINPSAALFEAPLGEISAEELFRPVDATHRSAPGAGEGLDGGGHVARTHSTSFTFDGPADWAAFGIWLSMLLHARGESVLRVKGLLDVGGPGPVVLNGVQHVMHPPQHLDAWPDEDHRSRLVLIARGVSSGEILASLKAFRPLVGAGPLLLEADVPV
ncbi:MAG: cobalamin biosynthesis protein CobW [Actinobacteria bacterium]|nr:MAG: cobalamin biosynthesis protein CobW [Actinomycetota bacterium]